MSKREYFIKDYVVGQPHPWGLSTMRMPEYINLIPDIGISMKPTVGTPPLKINAWFTKSRRKAYFKIICEVVEAK